MDTGRSPELRLSDDTLEEDDENWNRKRYQREDEDLWGSEPVVPVQTALSGSSVGVAGLPRPTVSRSESYHSTRAPPVNDLHPPIVSLPSPRPTDNRWMMQPPPKASVMSGKERATNRSRSGSGASSRVELSLQRQVSARQLKNKINHGETPRTVSRGSSYNNLLAGQRHDRPRTPQTRPISAASSRKKRRDTAMTRSDVVMHSSDDSSDDLARNVQSFRTRPGSGIKIVRVRSSRQQLSTVMSSGSGNPAPTSPTSTLGRAAENDGIMPKKPFPLRTQRPDYITNVSTNSLPYTKNQGSVTTSNRKSLTVLQDLVAPRPAKIRTPSSGQGAEKKDLATDGRTSKGLKSDRVWGPGMLDGEVRVPFDSSDASEAPRDPSMRWSVDF